MALCHQQLARAIPETCVIGKVLVFHVQHQEIKWQSVQRIVMAIMFGILDYLPHVIAAIAFVQLSKESFTAIQSKPFSHFFLLKRNFPLLFMQKYVCSFFIFETPYFCFLLTTNSKHFTAFLPNKYGLQRQTSSNNFFLSKT